MDDTDIPDPILKQIPLIKNPAFQPPKPITLNSNYNKLLPNLASSVIPPKINLSTSDINKWVSDIEELRKEECEKSVNEFKDWIKSKQLQIAPGFKFEDEVMKPSKASSKVTVPHSGSDDISKTNELDKLFGKSINE